MGLETPGYCESFNGKTFSLELANETYPLQTRDLLSGIVNPPEMIDVIVSSLTKYRSKTQFDALIEETVARVSGDSIDGMRMQAVILTPKGKRFAYSYEDEGAVVQESWVNNLQVTLDTTSGLVHAITMEKSSRRFEASATDSPSIETTRVGYRFFYTRYTNVLVPSKLVLSLNGTESMTIDASYRTYDKNHIAFDSKTICVKTGVRNDTGTCLSMQYGAYKNNVCRFGSTPVVPSAKYGKELSKAAELSRKASDLLRKGNITASTRVLRTIADKYPETPQGVEAKRILSRVPLGLH